LKTDAAVRRAQRKRMKQRRQPQHPQKASAACAPDDFHPRVFAAEYFGFHFVCSESACRRAQHCTGGANPPCFRTLWPLVPTREKVRFRATVMAKGDESVTAEQAMAAGDAMVARYDTYNPPAPEDMWETDEGEADEAGDEAALKASDDNADADADAHAAVRIRSL
jgi:hypothetical protein